jgi:hypothetical protein
MQEDAGTVSLFHSDALIMNMLLRPNRTRLLPTLAAWMLSGTAFCATGQPLPEPGLMLREGVWNGDVGTFVVPPALAGKPVSTWPADGWYRLRQDWQAMQMEAVVAPASVRPQFLQSIARQAEMSTHLSPQDAETPGYRYLRVPGTRLTTGTIKPYLFRNGTAQLTPKLDFRYELALGGKTFAFTVQNGLRGRNGEPYGDGAQYLIEYDGQKFEYSLEGFGWDSRIQGIADLDDDGKPDFLVNVGGSNSGYEYLLLSSLAKPGRNPPTASLRSLGC